MKAVRHNLFHRLLQVLREGGIQQKKIIVAVSGGVDSVVLLDLLWELSPILQIQLTACYVHHGSQNHSFRDEAQVYVQSLAAGLGVEFITNIPEKNHLRSEEDLRNFRYQRLYQWRKKFRTHYIALAHTADDLLETRLLRLIRGTGSQGLSSMTFKKDFLLRPFLRVTKDEIKDYARFQKLECLEDPSNSRSKQIMRNWLRSVWLPSLEKKQKGAVRSLGRSLERLHLSMPVRQAPAVFDFNLWKGRPLHEQKQALAEYIREMNLKNYSDTLMTEILKWLGQNKKTVSKRWLGKTWICDSGVVKIHDLL